MTVFMDELRLSPLALQTQLMRRWRAELGRTFFENVIAFPHRASPGVVRKEPGGQR